jgi:hypothetical protein
MSENKLSLIGSEQFRNSILVKNLKPYNVSGNFTPAQEPINYETELTVDGTVRDSENISTNITFPAKNKTIPNKYGADDGNFIDGAELIQDVTLANPVNVVTDNESITPAFPPRVEYNYSDSKLDLVSEFFIDNSEVINRFVPNEGYEDMYIVTDTIVQKDVKFNGVYPEFVQGTYSILDIISNNEATSNDSYIQRIGADRLKFSFEERVFEEIRKNTLGRVNILNQPDLSLFVTGQVPLTDKNWTITVPDGLLDNLVALTQRITGTYYPQSPIEGEYFETPQRRATKAGQLLQKGIRNLSNNNSPSQKFIANTGSGQKSTLFANLDYNKYKPGYSGKLNYYVGNENLAGALVASPADDVPKTAEGLVTTTTVYGPDKLATLFDGNVQYQFGMASKTYDERPVFDGGFVWVQKGKKSDEFKKVGHGGEKFGKNDASNSLRSAYDQVLSTDYEFRPGSILDATQRLIDATPNRGVDRLAHVGNAINQVSKVFWDGYKEITKGSKVRTYVNEKGKEVGKEYGRVFAKDNPYFTYSNLQGTIANTSGSETNGNIRRFSYSVLDSTYNLNITPFKNGGTSVKDGKVKKYMVSIENLAWKGSPEYDDLPACEKGPNGGRIMWFPPYDLTFSDSSAAGWNPTNFLGRPEPIYTYQNTTRTGSIGFKVIVDHPSVLNLIVNKELNKEDNYTTQQVINSFFAGLKKYDIYEIAKKFNSLSLPTIEQAYQSILENPNATREDIQGVANGLSGPSEINNSENIQVDGWAGIRFFFNPEPPFDNSKNFSEVSLALSTLLTTKGDNFDTFGSQIVEYNNVTIEDIRQQITSIITDKKGKISIELEPGLSSINASDIELSVTKYFTDITEIGEKSFENGDIKINVLTSPSTTIIPKNSSGNGGTYNCPNNQYDPSSIDSFACSSALIKNITVTPSQPTAQGENQNNQNRANQNVNNGLPTQPNTDIIDKTKNISKKILRELLVESDYFEMIKQDTPFLYDSIKQKIKYFHPAFHSITPEGLNSRITFLNQCVRPGRTIPTERGNDLIANDSFNTNFGTPPVLILRIGDFYNTKIIPDGVTFTYENLDINPEGIGVQPMIASVQINFKMIGGHGLKEPVEKLQNALSFNFYANTEMYDDRADVTEDTTAIDNELVSAIFNNEPIATINDVSNIIENDGGDTIGKILTITPNTGGTQTGTISYTTFVDEVVNQTKEYFDETNKFITSTVNQYGYGLFKQFSTYRKYFEGDLNDFNVSKYPTKIYGKTSYEGNIGALSLLLQGIVTAGNDVFHEELTRINSPISDRLALTTNFNTLIQNKSKGGFSDLSSSMNDFANKQANYIQFFRKMDFILSSTDGKILNNNSPKIYDLSGTTTLTAMTSDYGVISDDLNNFSTLLSDNDLYPSGDNKYIEDSAGFYFTPFVDSNVLQSNNNVNLIYTLFASDLLDEGKKQKFRDDLIKNINTQQSIDGIDTIIGRLVDTFQKEKTKEMETINSILSGAGYDKYLNYNPLDTDGKSIKGKERTVNFTTSNGTDEQKNRIKKIYSSENTGSDDKFNDKKKFL